MEYVKHINKTLELDQCRPLPRPKTKIAATGLMKIGQLATKTGTTVSAIRFWAHNGLLTFKTTTASGYWLFMESSIQCVLKIKELQKKRYTIREIQQILHDQDTPAES
jgi:DNA-binding transcriptional MerR regulator